ncbi:conserved hypothetical protein [Nitrosopumilaceae archaeon]|nr:conserved hypothetical protein [Nitrosopumilaceae archaeon]
MPGTAWKCYRCNLSFRSEETARMHRQISSHSVTKVRAIEA